MSHIRQILACAMGVAIAAAPLSARQSDPSSPAPALRWPVIRARSPLVIALADPVREIRGRFLRADADSLILQNDDPPAVSGTLSREIVVPRFRIRHIDREESRSQIGGAILGALYASTCIKWWCEGPSSDRPGMGSLLIGAGLGAALGAAIAGSITRRIPIFDRKP